MRSRLFSRIWSLIGVFVFLLAAVSPAWAKSYELGSNQLAGARQSSSPVKDVQGPTADPGAISHITAGGDHNCLLTVSGAVKCWGRNDFRQLGDGSTVNLRTFPWPAVGMTNGIKAVVAGSTHTCALVDTPTISGGIKCWGLNGSGQLGIGNTEQYILPVDVINLNGITAISAGGDHTCALTAGGGVKCWGGNSSGELGDNSTTNRPAAVDVTNLSANVKSITAGVNHTCALTISNEVKCWGDNSSGQLGNDTAGSQSKVPVSVKDLSGTIVLVVAGGAHTCALNSDGEVQCWGGNSYGQLGNNSQDDSPLPVSVSGLSGEIISGLAAGISHTCSLNNLGGVKCWGLNESGQLGNNTQDDSPVPVIVSGLSGIVMITAGWSHTCVLTSDNIIKCWGRNKYGQLGDGSTSDRMVPVEVSGPPLLFLPTVRRNSK